MIFVKFVVRLFIIRTAARRQSAYKSSDGSGTLPVFKVSPVSHSYYRTCNKVDIQCHIQATLCELQCKITNFISIFLFFSPKKPLIIITFTISLADADFKITL